MNWEVLCANDSIFWNADLIESFIDKIDWNSLSENILGANYRYIIMRFEWDIFEKYENYWNWNEVSKSRFAFPEHIIDKYADNWDWKELINNDEISWSFELFIKYNKYISSISLDKLQDSQLWEKLIKIDEQVLVGKILTE